ncbi:uncharacterized protein [Aegilops tauschii subsp. strangulata]|uniref:uncharacterized protein n=1 Tax=Aegilops tauschii subsp. strangulata TaxID=200361 RepID=UPI003CC84D79
MVEEPSTKRHQDEPSDKSSNLVDVHVPGEKREYTKTLRGVELHGKETLEIVCTSEPDKADEVISRLWRKLGRMLRRFVGVGVHYTNEDEPPQMAAVLQLCVDDLCLVYHIAAATKWPKHLNELLHHETLFTFAGFSIESDKEKLKLSTSVIHPFYKAMKKNINTQEDYKLWGTSPLPDNLIEYAGVDAYATYKSWSMIDYITDGSEYAKQREDAKFYDHAYCPF